MLASLLGIACAGCASSSSETVYMTRMPVTPIARTVSPLGSSLRVQPGDDSARLFAESFNAGNPAYDSIRRPPGRGINSLKVDCNTVRRIGVSFIVNTSRLGATEQRSRFILHFEWTMPGRDQETEKHHYYKASVNPAWYLLDKSERFVSAGLLLDRTRRPRNGDYVVTASYRGDVIYTEQFTIVGCGKIPPAPLED